MITALVVLVLAADPVRTAEPDPQKVCSLEENTCRDGCSLDYGTSAALTAKLTTCLEQCDERANLCLLRFVAKRQVQSRSEPVPPPVAEEPAKPRPGTGPYLQPMQGPKPSEVVSPELAKPADPGTPIRRDVTRASEFKDAPEKSYKPAPPLAREPEPAAAPAPAPAPAKAKKKSKVSEPIK